ncbi:MAG: hypothetical protein AAF367_06770 [Pseudomonadota bacterium]
MTKTQSKPQEIVAKLPTVEGLAAQGMARQDAIRQIGVGGPRLFRAKPKRSEPRRLRSPMVPGNTVWMERRPGDALTIKLDRLSRLRKRERQAFATSSRDGVQIGRSGVTGKGIYRGYNPPGFLQIA